VHVIDKNDVNYVYLGSGKLYDRTKGNASKLKNNTHGNKQLQKAYNEVRECKIEILEVCNSIEEARAAENDYIEFYKKLDDVIVCNKYEAVTMEKPYKLILDKEKVIEIKMLLEKGETRNKDIASLYGVKDSLISKIKNGFRWASVSIQS